MRRDDIAYTLTSPWGTTVLGARGTGSLWIEDVSWGSALRANVVNRAQGHGAYSDPGWKEGGVWAATVVLRVQGRTDAQINDDRASLVGAVNSLLGDRGRGTLSWTDPDEGAHSLTVLALQDIAMKYDTSRGALVAELQLHSDQPFAQDSQGAAVDTSALDASGGGFVIPLTLPVTFISSGGGTVTVTNNGDGQAYPKLLVYGPITNPVVWNRETGERLDFTGSSIADGDYWCIDLFERTVTLNATDPTEGAKVSSINPLASTWFGVQPAGSAGTTVQLQLSGSAFTAGTRMSVQMYDAKW